MSRAEIIAQAEARNAAARAALDQIRAKLDQRSREADLWDASGRDERINMLARSYRKRQREGGNVPVPRPSRAMVGRCWDELSEAEQNIARVAARPYVTEAQEICARNEVVGL